VPPADVWQLNSVAAVLKHTTMLIVFQRDPQLHHRATHKAQRKQTKHVGGGAQNLTQN